MKINKLMVGLALTFLVFSPRAKAAAALWISAPTWSYSAAAADSPAGWAYFWGLSVGAGTYSFAYAYSNDGLGDAGYAFAEAATGQGGMGAVQVAGFADPWAGNSIDITLDDPSNPSDYQTTEPGSDPFSSSYTVSGTGITFTESGEELNGSDELEAFVYNGATDAGSLESELGAGSEGGTTLSGDVTDLSTLESDFGLIPLDSAIDDPNDIGSLAFTENTGDIALDYSNVILISIEDTPEPSTTCLLGIGMASLLIFRKRRVSAVA